MSDDEKVPVTLREHYGVVELNFILSDSRFVFASGAAAKLYIVLWCRAIQLQRETLPAGECTDRALARISGLDRRTIQNALCYLANPDAEPVRNLHGTCTEPVRSLHTACILATRMSQSCNKDAARMLLIVNADFSITVCGVRAKNHKLHWKPAPIPRQKAALDIPDPTEPSPRPRPDPENSVPISPELAPGAGAAPVPPGNAPIPHLEPDLQNQANTLTRLFEGELCGMPTNTATIRKNILAALARGNAYVLVESTLRAAGKGVKIWDALRPLDPGQDRERRGDGRKIESSPSVDHVQQRRAIADFETQVNDALQNMPTDTMAAIKADAEAEADKNGVPKKFRGMFIESHVRLKIGEQLRGAVPKISVAKIIPG